MVNPEGTKNNKQQEWNLKAYVWREMSPLVLRLVLKDCGGTELVAVPQMIVGRLDPQNMLIGEIQNGFEDHKDDKVLRHSEERK